MKQYPKWFYDHPIALEIIADSAFAIMLALCFLGLFGFIG